MQNKTFEYENHYEMKVNRLKVLQQSQFICNYCGGKATEVHHLDGSKDNHSLENLIPTCHKCHMKIHRHGRRVPRWDSELILVAMMHRGIDKCALASRVGCSPATISKLVKTGQTKNSTMKRIAEALSYPVAAFMLPEASARLEALDCRTRMINAVKLAIDEKLLPVKDPILRNRFQIWLAKDIREHFGLRSYFNVPKERLAEAIEFVQQWRIPGTQPEQSDATA